MFVSVCKSHFFMPRIANNCRERFYNVDRPCVRLCVAVVISARIARNRVPAAVRSRLAASSTSRLENRVRVVRFYYARAVYALYFALSIPFGYSWPGVPDRIGRIVNFFRLIVVLHGRRVNSCRVNVCQIFCRSIHVVYLMVIIIHVFLYSLINTNVYL